MPAAARVPDVVEDGATLLDNARLKARALVVATGEAAVADDTGLEVDALGGAPGVYSARYAGEGVTYADNVAKLLRELAACREGGERRARSARWRWPPFPTAPRCGPRGRSRAPSRPTSAGSAGFGYDPVFVVAVSEGGDGRTFAEMTAGEKAAVSHRGRAFRALASSLAERGG